MGRRGPRHGGGGGGGSRGGGGPPRRGGMGGGGGGGRHDGGRFEGGSRFEGPGRSSARIPPPSPPRVVLVTEKHPPAKGPHPGYVSVACQFTSEQQLRRMQREHGCDPSREDSYRLQGVQLIDNVREALQLPVKTFTTACNYYHRFRLNFRDAEYNFQDAALSALFVACKVEDTLKKSRDVLCAAYNLKNPDKMTTPDDKIFDRPSTIIVGLDRLILQTVGFDFRVRHPQKLLVKVVRQLLSGGRSDRGSSRDDSEDAKAFLSVAYPMSIDLYKTFAPIKQTSFTMAMAIIELTALVLDRHVAAVRALDLDAYHTNRGCVVETLLDLLDLYTQFPKLTKIGARVDLNRFIDIKIRINHEVDETPTLHRTETWCDKCAVEDRDNAMQQPITPGSAASPATTRSGPPYGSGNGGHSSNGKPNLHKRQDGTMRFLFEAERMRDEQAEVAEYFREDYEEVTEVVEEPIGADNDLGHHNMGAGNNNNGGSHRSHHSHHSHQNNYGSGNNNNNNNNNRRRDRGHYHASGSGGGGGGGGGAGAGAGSEHGWGPYHRISNNSRNHEHRQKPKKGGYY